MRDAFLVAKPTTSALRAINYPRELNSLSRSRRGAFRAAPLRSMLSRFGDSYWSVFTRLDCAREHGVELISQTDMFAAEPEGRVIRRDSMPRPRDHEVSRWQVLVAGAGQMGEGNLFGRSIIADNRLAGRFLGPHAVGLTFEEPGAPTNLWTYAFLNTAAGLRAVRSCAFGTSVPGLRLDLLAALSIPLPEDGRLLERVALGIRTAVSQREIYLNEVLAARAVIESVQEMREAYQLCAARKARSTVWKGPLSTLCAWNYASTGTHDGCLADNAGRADLDPDIVIVRGEDGGAASSTRQAPVSRLRILACGQRRKIPEQDRRSGQRLGDPLIHGHLFGDRPRRLVRIAGWIGSQVPEEHMQNLVVQHPDELAQAAGEHELGAVEEAQLAAPDRYAHRLDVRVAHEAAIRKQVCVKRVRPRHPLDRDVEEPGCLAASVAQSGAPVD